MFEWLGSFLSKKILRKLCGCARELPTSHLWIISEIARVKQQDLIS